MKTKTTLFLFLISNTFFAQQFVNGSFELNTSGNTWISHGFTPPSNLLYNTYTHWFNNVTCNPQNGSLFLYKSENVDYTITLKLTSPLIAGQTYEVNFDAFKFFIANALIEIYSSSDTATKSATSTTETISLNTDGTWTNYNVQITPNSNSDYIELFCNFQIAYSLDNFSISLVTSAKNENTPSSSTVFPNPSNGIFTFSNSKKINTITIQDISGKVISHHDNIQSGSYQVDLINHPEGIYFARITEENGYQSTIKLINK